MEGKYLDSDDENVVKVEVVEDDEPPIEEPILKKKSGKCY
jgi:hypothetical protein